MNKEKELEKLNKIFELNPLKHNYNYYVKEEIKKELLYRIVSKSITLIIGQEGLGKTSLLKYVINNFKGKNKILYINANREYNLEKLLKNRKDMILLFDNISFLKKSELEKIKYYYDEDIVSSIIFTTNNKNTLNFTDSMWSRIGRNIINLEETSFEYFKLFVLDRLKEKNIFSDNSLKTIYDLSSNNKVRLLVCKRVFEYIENLDKENVNEKLMGKILKEIETHFKNKK